jgi:hypothetical protein
MKLYADIGEDDLVEVVADYDYQPEERATRDYPGCSEYVQVYEVLADGIDVTDKLTKKQVSAIEYDILEKLHERDYE